MNRRGRTIHNRDGETVLDRSLQWDQKIHGGLDWINYDPSDGQPIGTVGMQVFIELKDGSVTHFPVDANQVQWRDWPHYPEFDIRRYAFPKPIQTKSPT